MRKYHKILFLYLVIQVFAADLNSQKLSDTLHLEEINVSSMRPLHESSLTLTRLDSLVMQNKACNSLSELLSEHTGIFIKSYGRGAMASASFRGTDPSHTKVLWNGIELNSPMLGMVDFSIIPVFLIDNVELLHGTSSMDETTGAFGGLINLSTKPDWNNLFSGSYMQGAGSFGTHDEHLRINAGNNTFQSQTRIFYAHSENDFSFENHDIIDSVDLETGKRYYPVMKNTDAWFTYYGILQEIHYRPRKNDFLSMSFWGQESSRSIPLLSTSESGPNNNINRQGDNSIRSQFSYNHYGKRTNFKVFSGLNYMDLNYSLKNRLPDESYLLAINSKSRTSSLYNKFDFQYLVATGLRFELAAGSDLHQVESLEKIKLSGYTESRVHSHVSGAVFKKWNNRLTSNIRVGGELIGKDKLFAVYHAGTEFHILPDDKLYLRLILASNAKYPSLNDLYYQPGGNPDLKAERSNDQELGIHYNFEGEGLNFSQDVSFYMSQVKDWIMWYYSVRGFSPQNIDNVDIKGIETNSSLTFIAGKTTYKLNSAYTLTQSQDMGAKLNDFDFSYGKQLPYIPVHSANVMFYAMRNNWSFTYIWNFFSKRYTTTSNLDPSRSDCLYPYFMSQAGLGKQLNIGGIKLNLDLKVHNLFNEEYRSVLQRAMPGRNYSLQLKLNF
jgi:iron complex outermembrane receptor protein